MTNLSQKQREMLLQIVKSNLKERGLGVDLVHKVVFKSNNKTDHNIVVELWEESITVERGKKVHQGRKKGMSKKSLDSKILLLHLVAINTKREGLRMKRKTFHQKKEIEPQGSLVKKRIILIRKVKKIKTRRIGTKREVLTEKKELIDKKNQPRFMMKRREIKKAMSNHRRVSMRGTKTKGGKVKEKDP